MDEERIIVERRITQRVYGYWDRICAGRPMPEESDIDPDALGDDWPNCFLLQTRDIEEIDEFNFTYLGEGILAAYKNAGIDMDNLHLIGPNAFYLAPQFKSVIRDKAPLIDDGYFFDSRKRKIRYRQCLLPVGTGKRVEGIFGAMLFRQDINYDPMSLGVVNKSIW